MISLVEGTTLVLFGLRRPVEARWGQPIATIDMGPIHGVAFLLYVVLLVRTVSGGRFALGEVARMVIAALVPFGAFVNERGLKRGQALLELEELRN